MSWNLDDYVEVKDRLPLFWKRHPDGRIATKIVSHENGMIVMKAGLFANREDKTPVATGYAYEREGEGNVNRTSYIENCETSAIGRALANMGILGRPDAPRPSREEMEKVARGRKSERSADRTESEPKAEAPAQACPKCGGDIWDNREDKASGEKPDKWPTWKCRDRDCKWASWDDWPEEWDAPTEEADTEGLRESLVAMVHDIYPEDEPATLGRLIGAYGKVNLDIQRKDDWTAARYRQAMEDIAERGEAAFDGAWELLADLQAKRKAEQAKRDTPEMRAKLRAEIASVGDKSLGWAKIQAADDYGTDDLHELSADQLRALLEKAKNDYSEANAADLFAGAES